MSERSESLRDRLRRFGDPDDFAKWTTGESNYVTTLELTADDVPALIAVTQEWTEEVDEDENDVSGFAPVHAWRCLAQLGAVEAVTPLLALLDPLDALDDEWYMEELPDVLAAMGPTMLPALQEYLADSSHAVFSRECAAHCLSVVSQRHTQARDQAVAILADELAKFQDADPGINAYLIRYLLELKATEAAEVIERAHAADRVDLKINGNWNTVRKSLGVPGLGLVSEELAAKRIWPFPPNLTSQFLSAPGELADSKMYEPAPSRAASRARRSRLAAPVIPRQAGHKIGRNDPCPCHSGKKYKKCCGR